MFNYLEEEQEDRPVSRELKVDLDLRSKEGPEQPEWLDEPRRKRPSRRRISPKPVPPVLKPSNPILD
jgi:hypothetical protein